MSTLLTIDRYLHRSGISLEGIGIDLPELAEPHPNRIPFRGILTKLNQPSTRPPGGSEGHRVQIPADVAQAALNSLIGMPVNFSDDFSDHEKRQPIGTITEAHIAGDDLNVSGYLYGKNFPSEVAYIKSNKANLGMSYEIGEVEIDSTDSTIWTLNHLLFTGAAILYKDKAAYQQTSVHAAADDIHEQLLVAHVRHLGLQIGRLATSAQRTRAWKTRKFSTHSRR